MLPGGNRQQEPVSRSAPAANCRAENYRSRLMRGGCSFVLGYRLVGGLLFQFAFEFVQLALDASIASSTDSSKALDWWQATRSSPGMCSVMVAILFPFSWSLSSFRMTSAPSSVPRSGPVSSSCVHEFDQPFVGVEFHGLNLYVHSLTVYKS